MPVVDASASAGALWSGTAIAFWAVLKFHYAFASGDISGKAPEIGDRGDPLDAVTSIWTIIALNHMLEMAASEGGLWGRAVDEQCDVSKRAEDHGVIQIAMI